MNIDELVEYTGINKSTIYSFTHKNKIPFIKRAKHLVFDRDKIDQWLEQGSVQVDSSIHNRNGINALEEMISRQGRRGR
jgi:excisionase family DNA binding protein